MTRRFDIKRLASYLVTLIGVVMIAVSIYYLAAYMRSGSDAAQFNLEVVDEERNVLLGRQAPRPGSYQPPQVKPVPARSEAIAEESEEALVDVVEPVRNEAERVEAEPADAKPVGSPSNVARAESGVQAEPSPEEAPAVEIDVGLFANLYPGGNMNPRYWGEPHWAGNVPFGGPTIPEGFMPVESFDVSTVRTHDERAVRMRIPAIKLDAAVSELEILDLGDSRAWSTPDRVVGHIPTTANPGEPRNGWYFGHLDNFISNEGDIFRRLPEIAELYKYDPVDIFIETEEAEYMYRVTGTRQMHEDDLRITDTNDAQIVLVTCWPFRVYDQRILVSASLVAVKPLS